MSSQVDVLAADFIRTSHGNDLNNEGQAVTESQFAILLAAACEPDATPRNRAEKHHELVRAGVEPSAHEESSSGAQLGRPSGARFKTYERLKRYSESAPALHARLSNSLFCLCYEETMPGENKAGASADSDELARLRAENRKPKVRNERLETELSL